MKVYEDGAVKLTTYENVPNHTTQAPFMPIKPGINPQNSTRLKLQSDIYEIRVKSAATNGIWVPCFANYTYNRALEIEDVAQVGGSNSPVVVQHYQNLTSGWSHTFANIEMSENSPVDVEIRKIGDVQLDGMTTIVKSAVYPASKAQVLPDTIDDGETRVYFRITNPCQVVIDINGQMDDHNAAINPPAGNAPVHAVSFFANPILPKPNLNLSGVVSLAPGTPAPNPATFNTLVFQPGVHEIGLSFPLHPGKSYYIPGDAVLIGTFSNLLSTPGTFRTKGDNIRIFGYGVISDAIYTHYLYPGAIQGPTTNSDRTIVIEEGVSCELYGITINDPANHSASFVSWSGADLSTDKSYTRWMKSITWRANGDGLGGPTDLEDCFLRTADDSTYATANRRRCTFWKDVNAALVHMPDIPHETIYIEDCDVIYNRLRTSNGSNGGGFQVRDGGKGVVSGNTIIRNIRFHDKRSNMSAISFDGVGVPTDISTAFRGVRFENISIEPPINGVKQKILGSATAPWFGGLIFKNVTIGGVALNAQNFSTYFTTNEWVNYMLFDDPTDLTLTTDANAANGEVRRSINQLTYKENSSLELTAVARPGETVFSHWSGDATGSDNPITVWMTGHKTITANFRPATINEQVVITAPSSGTWTVPAGVYSATFATWAAGGAGGSAYNGSTSVENTQARASGGAGGSYATRTTRVRPGQIITYSVGAGGEPTAAGFINNSRSGSGEASSVSANGASAIAVGGPGGINIAASNQILSGPSNIAPTTGNVGDTIFYGGNGANANANGSGGGGGSAGSQGAGGHAPSPLDSNSPGGVAGLGGGATGGSGNNATLAGIPGGSPGAGGSGAVVRTTNNTYLSGGKGGDGQVTINYNTISFTLTTNTNGVGSVLIGTPGNPYISGTTVSVSAMVPYGYLFTGWSGALSGTVSPTTLLMDDDKTITANYEVDPNAGNVWDGGGTADSTGNYNWSDPANWAVNTPAGGNLVFAQSTGVKSFNNLADNTPFTGIVFNSTAGAFTLAGNRIALNGNILNESSNAQTLNFPIILSPTRTFTSAAGTIIANGILSGSGGFIKAGPSNMILSGTNSYSGTTAIQNGSLILKGGDNRILTTSVVTLGLATPTVTSGILQLGDSEGAVNQSITSITTPGNESNKVVGGHSSNSTLSINNTTTVTYNGSFGGAGTNHNNLSLTKAGTGLLALRGISTLVGPISIQNGTVELANGNNRLPVTSSVILGEGATSGTLQLGNSVSARSQTLASLTTSGTGTANQVVGAHGTNFPVLTINNPSDVTYNGILGGPTANNNRINFAKGGSGTLTLSGTHTYFGTTTVTLGTLLLTGQSPAAIGAVSITGGKLAGTGSIGGTVTIGAAGSISPGVAIGTLTIGAGLNLSALANNSSGKLIFQLGPINASDKLVVSGSLTLGSGILGFSDFDFSATTGLENGTYRLITNATSLSGTLDPNAQNRSGTIGSGPAVGTLQLSGNDLELVVSGVPIVVPGPLDRFSISPITSPSIVNTAITGITITALDAANQIVTSFTGTVTFGGTGGFSGTSSTFTAGVLTGVSVTPANAGNNLTLTVTGGASRSGTAIISSIQTPYQAWASGALFDGDQNNDALKNGLAWLLGATSATSPAPRLSATENTPGLVLNFTVLNAANRGSSTLQLEHSSDLGTSDPWQTVNIPEATSTTPTQGVTFTIAPNGRLNNVTATIEKTEARNGKLFSRLKATQ
jgi:autotransporter-associated beta strand protein